MKVSLCLACQTGLVFGAQACNHCGRLVKAAEAPDVAPKKGWHARLLAISSFFESQASLTLATLLILLGLGIALVPVGWNYARVGPATQAPASAPGTCSGLTVFFAEMATVGEMKDLLDQLHVAIVSGPNAAGAFELAAPEGALPGLAQSLGQAESTVEGVFLKPPCRKS